VALVTMTLAYVRRQEWIAELQASRIVNALAVAMSDEKPRQREQQPDPRLSRIIAAAREG
jgi:hypothetical protein